MASIDKVSGVDRITGKKVNRLVRYHEFREQT